MAGLIAVLGTTTAYALAATSERALVSLVSTNNIIYVKEWSVWFDGLLSSASPVEVKLAGVTTAGDLSTATAFSQVLRHGTTGAVMRGIGRTINSTSTGLPVSTGWFARRFVHPQVGYHEKFPLGDEPTIQNGQAVAIFVNSPATVDAHAELVFEE